MESPSQIYQTCTITVALKEWSVLQLEPPSERHIALMNPRLSTLGSCVLCMQKSRLSALCNSSGKADHVSTFRPGGTALIVHYPPSSRFEDSQGRFTDHRQEVVFGNQKPLLSPNCGVTSTASRTRSKRF